MKRWICLMLALGLVLAGCGTGSGETTAPSETTVPQELANTDIVAIALEEDTVYVEDGVGVYTDHDIVYYEAGHDFTYGEGEPGDEHEAAEAQAHTVIHITQPGTYKFSGTMSAGQIAVDLGEDAEEDPNAVVTLILDGVDITCTVAPAIIFYHVYECGSADAETAGPVVDTSAAGANVIIADGSVNTVNGSYVARIYKEGTVELSEDGTEVVEAKKLHKYDAALYSKMSMNVSGGEIGDGVLTINAENEGLDSELHLTINGGNIFINSGNDGINTNEDGVSVTTVNGGNLTINVLGATGEGDGIDSNGWLVINGGTVAASACGFSGDAGIDSDMGIYISGGTVMASGNMLDQIAGGEATYGVFQFASTQSGGNTYTLKNEAGETVIECTPANDFSYLILSGEALVSGSYSFWMGETRLAGISGGMMGGPGMNGGVPQMPGRLDVEPPEGDYEIPPQPGGDMVTQGASGDRMPTESDDPENSTLPGGGPSGLATGEIPEGMPGPIESMPGGGEYEIPPQPGENVAPQGGMPGGFGQTGEATTDFVIVAGGNYFTGVTPAE